MRSLITILALWAAGLGAAAQFGKLSVAFDTLSALYPGHEGLGIGLALSVVGLVGLVLGTTAGVLVARIGPRRSILTALVAGALISAMQAALPVYPLLLLTRVVEGLSHLAIVIVGPTMIAGLAGPRGQGAAMTLWSSFFGLAYAALFFFAPGLIARQGAEGLFLAHAAWMAAIAGILAVLLHKDSATAGEGRISLWAEHLAIYTSPRVAAPAMGFVCYTFTYVAILTLLPGIMGPAGGFVGVAMPLVSIGLSLTLGVWLLGRISAVRMVQGGFGLAILAAIGLWACFGGAGAAPFALLLAGALGLVQGASFAALAELNPLPRDRARGAGAIAQLGNLGTTCGTPLLIVILAKAGVTGLALFVIGFSALGIALHRWQASRRLSG